MPIFNKQQESSPLRLTFELHEDGSVVTSCSWPIPNTMEDASNIVNAFANLVYLSSTGKLLPQTQQAIANFMKDDKKASTMSKGILATLNGILEAGGMKINTDEPVVPPRKCFNVRGGSE